MAIENKTPVSEESSFGIELLTWLEVNKKRLIIAGIVAFGIWFAFTVYIHIERQREETASAELSALRGPIGYPMNYGIPAQKYFEIAEKYSGTDAAPRALLLGASALFQEGKYAEAQANFQKFLDKYQGHILSGQAALGIAACLEAQDKENEALTKYQEVSARYSTEPAVALPAKLSFARLSEKQGKLEQAYNTYNELARTDAFTSWGQEAMMRLHELEKKHPDLAKAKQQQIQQSMQTTLTNIVVNTNAKPKATGAVNKLSVTSQTNVIKLTPATNK